MTDEGVYAQDLKVRVMRKVKMTMGEPGEEERGEQGAGWRRGGEDARRKIRHQHSESFPMWI